MPRRIPSSTPQGHRAFWDALPDDAFFGSDVRHLYAYGVFDAHKAMSLMGSIAETRRQESVMPLVVHVHSTDGDLGEADWLADAMPMHKTQGPVCVMVDAMSSGAMSRFVAHAPYRVCTSHALTRFRDQPSAYDMYGDEMDPLARAREEMARDRDFSLPHAITTTTTGSASTSYLWQDAGTCLAAGVYDRVLQVAAGVTAPQKNSSKKTIVVVCDARSAPDGVPLAKWFDDVVLGVSPSDAQITSILFHTSSCDDQQRVSLLSLIPRFCLAARRGTRIVAIVDDCAHPTPIWHMLPILAACEVRAMYAHARIDTGILYDPVMGPYACDVPGNEAFIARTMRECLPIVEAARVAACQGGIIDAARALDTGLVQHTIGPEMLGMLGTHPAHRPQGPRGRVRTSRVGGQSRLSGTVDVTGRLRVFAIGDLEGQLDVLLTVLFDLGVLEQDKKKGGGGLRWIGDASTYVVQCGDQVDNSRVEEDLKQSLQSPDWVVVAFLRALVKLSKGHMYSIIGNHEFMNLDWTAGDGYVGKADMNDGKRMEYMRSDAFARHLAERHLYVRIGPLVFSHAGFLLDEREEETLDKVIDRTNALLDVAIGRRRHASAVSTSPRPVADALDRINTIVWSRIHDTSRRGGVGRDESDAVRTRLASAGITHMVVGHNKVRDRRVRVDGPDMTDIVYSDNIVNIGSIEAPRPGGTDTREGKAVSVVQVPCFYTTRASDRPMQLTWRTVTHVHPRHTDLVSSIVAKFTDALDEPGSGATDLSDVYRSVPSCRITTTTSGATTTTIISPAEQKILCAMYVRQECTLPLMKEHP